MKSADELIASWEPLFNPRSVAVVGASNGIGKWGFIIPMNLVTGGYEGKLYMVNPKEKSIQGLPTVKSLAHIQDEVDLVMVTVPAPLVIDVIDQAADIGAKNMVVISSGFSETGAEGMELEKKLQAKALGRGVRVIGPNTMGISSPPTNMFATGAFAHPPAGNVAFVSQSGNLGVQLLGWAAGAGLGISRFIGSGNEAVVTCDQILEYYGADPETRVIIMYLEGIDDGRRFLEVARKVTPHKPVIALKMGATEAGAKAAASHSGAVSTPHRVYQAMVKQAGILEASSTEEMVNLARTFGNLPIPQGRRVGIMTMGGGWGVVTTDACSKAGLSLPQPSAATIEAIDQVLPKFWSRGNPVDLVGTVNRSAHFRVLEALVSDPCYDSIITLGSLTGMKYMRDSHRREGRRALRAIIKRHGWNMGGFLLSIYKGVRQAMQKRPKKQVIEKNKNQSGGINFREARQWKDELFSKELRKLMQASGKPIVPVPFEPATVADIFKGLELVAFGIPEDAVVAISKLADYHSFLERHKMELERDDLEIPNDDMALAIGSQMMNHSGAMSEHESKEVLTRYGISVTDERLASSEQEAALAAREIGFPVVVKIDSPDIGHKTDLGCVQINLETEDEVREAFRTVTENAQKHAPKARISGVLVQEMVSGGTEVIIGVSTDPHYGQTIVFGLGGIFVEVLEDVSLRILPIELVDAEAMVREIKGYKVLEGTRGKKPRDIQTLAETIRRVADLADDLKDHIAEMDINPLMVFEKGKGVKALDALIVLKDK